MWRPDHMHTEDAHGTLVDCDDFQIYLLFCKSILCSDVHVCVYKREIPGMDIDNMKVMYTFY